MQVLLVDSDRRALSMMDRAMRPLRGARISQVTSLKNANRCLENQVYDLIVCSYELRDGDSLSLFEAARAQDMAIIVASGFFDEATSMKLLAYPRTNSREAD